MPGQKRKTPEPQLTFAYRTGAILSVEDGEIAVGVNVAVIAIQAAAKAPGHKTFQEWAPPLLLQLNRLLALHPDWHSEIQAFALRLGHIPGGCQPFSSGCEGPEDVPPE